MKDVKLVSVLTRPGGFGITKRAFDACGLPKSANILDIGCGSGETAAYLHSEYGLRITGIDRSVDSISKANEMHPYHEFTVGDGQFLDFESRSFDCVLMECTLSLMSNPVEAVHEAYCVLKDGGFLIIHDVYLPKPTAEDFAALDQTIKAIEGSRSSGDCCDDHPSAHVVDGALVLNEINAEMNELGLSVKVFEDRKLDLDNYAATVVFNGGSLEDLCWTAKDKSKVSYFLLILKKEK